jgi:general secretion pathway protein D
MKNMMYRTQSLMDTYRYGIILTAYALVFVIATQTQSEIRDAAPIPDPKINAQSQRDISELIGGETGAHLGNLPLEFQPPIHAEIDALKALKKIEKEEDKIEFNFENADLTNLVTQIEDIFNVTFIPDDIIDPLRQGKKALRGNKITFKTNAPISKRQAWNLFTSFLNLASLTIAPFPDDPNMYFIMTVKNAYTSPVPTFIGVDYEKIPTNDQIIRYIYFVENMQTETLAKIVNSLKSSDAVALELKANKALLLIDKAYNVRELLRIVKELDQSSMPQAMSVLKLRFADATQVEALYKTLTQASDTPQPFIGPRKQPTSLYFPENTRMIAEPRTNALILLGEKDAIDKMENFITTYIDVDLEQPYAKLHTYQVRHASAETIANIMNNVTKFGQDTEIGKNGGVRGEDKYLRPMLFVAETTTNRIVVRGFYEDFLKAKEVMDQLDAPQTQVGIEVLILTVSLEEMRELGTQLRSRQSVCNDGSILGNNVKFQTSGLYGAGIQQNTSPGSLGVDRILGNLVRLATAAPVGSTVVTFGQDIVNGMLSVWGIFSALQTVTNLTVVANPFLVASNKIPAFVSVGQQRRVPTAEVLSGDTRTNTFENANAFLTVKITPQINSDGMIILGIQIDINDFTNPDTIDPTDPRNAEQTLKTIKSTAVVADREVLALGGLVKTTYTSQVSKTPLLGDIPGLGWLFKNKNKNNDKESLLVLISSRIIDPNKPTDIADFTAERMVDYYNAHENLINKPDQRDPVNRFFFDPLDKADALTKDFLAKQSPQTEKLVHEKRLKQKRKRYGNKAHARTPSTVKSEPVAVPKIMPPALLKHQDKQETFSQLANSNVSQDLLGRIKNKKRTELSLNSLISTDAKRGKA